MKGLLPRLGRPFDGARERSPAAGPGHTEEPLWLEWLALGGLLVFATWLLGARGVWGLLLRSDPTGITLVIIVVFSTATLWAGSRTRTLQRERRALRTAAPGWSADYLSALRASGMNGGDSATALDLLLEYAHGPHATAWWVNGIQLKLGLLGKVIGFSILALDIGNAKSFDASQSQELLRSLTTGLGVALLTTMVGLVANILLGLQLTRLDRYADLLVAETQRAGLALQPEPHP
ncbi:MotA/TolQ/ExbB proton channel family protein [soil metagenome]